MTITGLYNRIPHHEVSLTDEPSEPVTPPSFLTQTADTLEPIVSTTATIYSAVSSILGLTLSAAVLTLDGNAPCRIHPTIWSKDPISFLVTTGIGALAIKSVLNENTPISTKIRHLALGVASLTHSATQLFLSHYISSCH